MCAGDMSTAMSRALMPWSLPQIRLREMSMLPLGPCVDADSVYGETCAQRNDNASPGLCVDADSVYGEWQWYLSPWAFIA